MSRLLWGWQYHRCDVATGKQVYATTLDSRRAGGGGGKEEGRRRSATQTAGKDCDEVTENGRHEMQMKLRQTLTLALALSFLRCLSLTPSLFLSLYPSLSLSVCPPSPLAVLHMGRCSILHGAAWHILINWRAAHATCHMQHATIAKRAVSPPLPLVYPLAA